MRVHDSAELLARYRLWVYVTALAFILALRSVVGPSTARSVVVAVVVLGMVAAYTAHRYSEAPDPNPSVLILAGAGVGVVTGLALALSGTRTGLLFVGGGLLLVNRGVNGVVTG